MVRQTKPIRAGANEQRFMSEDLKNKTLDAERFVGVAEIQGDTTTAYGPGHGPKNRDAATGWSDLDLADDAGNSLNGKFRWEVYKDSSKEDLVAKSSTFQAGDLRSAVAADRTNKRNIPSEQPLAGNDSYLVLAFKVSDAHDGATVSANNSSEDLGIAFSEYK